MSGKNYGPAVSSYLIQTGRNWETVVFQAGKPVLDAELNLQQDVDGGQAEADIRRSMPSGWLSDDFLITSSGTSAIFQALTPITGAAASITAVVGTLATITGLTGMTVDQVGQTLVIQGAATGANNGAFPIAAFVSATSVKVTNASAVAPDANNGAISWAANTDAIQIPNLVAHVNGWIFNVQNSFTTGSNILNLGAGPSGNGTLRTDLVFLEVWRMLLSAAPSAVGKSASGRIWQQGNVKTDPANDTSLNFVDDIENSNVGAETTKRVQIQYRLRVVQGVNIFTHPYGLEDAAVIANTVPTDALHPDGIPSSEAFTYTNQSANGDPGLWVAGDGNPSNSMGTVDGFMYAIPLLGVFRRNTTGFNRILNQNGGASFPTTSDRPDGYWNNVLVARDIADLRMGVSPTGWNYSEVLEKNFNFLLDNNLHSEWLASTPFGGGYNGSTVFVADEIGPFPSDNAGPLIGNFDGGRRRFSGRSIYETITVQVPAPGGGWANGSSVTINPTALPIYPYSAYNWASFAPSGVIVADIENAYWIGPTAGKKTAKALNFIQTATNVGVTPIATLTLTFGTIAGLGLTNESLYVDLLVAYPTGVGLTRTPTASYGAASFPITGGSIPAGSPYNFGSVSAETFDFTHREAQLEYVTSNISISQAADTTITGDSTFRLPERAATLVTVQRNSAPLTGGVTLDTTGRIVTFTNALDYTSPGDTIQITYTAVRPFPQPMNNLQVTLYYEFSAPQAGRQALLGTTLQVIPKFVSKQLYVLTAGSGSQDESYPWPYGYVQTGGIWPNSTNSYTGENELSARMDVAVTEFNATTGFLQLPVYVPMVANPEQLSFTGVATDIEGRSFFNAIPGGTYIPNAYAQDLTDAKRHKNVLPVLCELAADTPLGHRGQLVMVLLIRYALFDQVDGVFFNTDQTVNTTVASVFRIKGNLLGKRAI